MERKHPFSFQSDTPMIPVIAEIAGGHMGDVTRCRELVAAAAGAGAQIVKFQFYHADELVERSHPDYELFRKLRFSMNDWQTIFADARAAGMKVFADVFGDESFCEAKELGVDGYKLHAADLDNLELLKKVAMTGETVLLGVGGHKRIEIYQAVCKFRSWQPTAALVLMPGHQLFPTPLAEHSLAEIRWLSEAYREFGVVVGCADHIDGDSEAAMLFPLAAIGAGAVMIEKHLTIRRADKWEDYESAIEPAAFATLVKNVRALAGADQVGMKWTEGRARYRQKAVKLPRLRADYQAGMPLTLADIDLVRPKIFADPLPMAGFIEGRKLKTDVKAGQFLTGADIEESVGIIVNVRMASQRLPEKAMLKICGKETIALLLERMRHCRGADRVVLATTENPEDDVLVELGRREGIEVFRGPDIDVAMRLYLTARHFGFDHIVRVTGDDLLRDIPMIEQAIESHRQRNADYTAMEGMVYSCDTEVISRRALETIVERARRNQNTEYLTWYLDDASAFVQNRVAVDEDYRRPYRLTLDTQEDFLLLTAIHEALYKNGQPVDLREALRFLDANPKIASLNAGSSPKLKREQLDLRIDV